MHTCTMPTLCMHLPTLSLHFPTQHLLYTCTYTTVTYHNIGRWKELSEQPNILPPHTHTPPCHNHKYARVCKHLVQAGVYTKTTTAYTHESADYQRVTTKSARCRQNHQTNILGLCTCTLCTYNPLTAQAPNATSKRYLTTQAQNASTNGGDASRVGKRCSYLFRRACFHLSLFPTRDASPPLVLAFCASVVSLRCKLAF